MFCYLLSVASLTSLNLLVWINSVWRYALCSTQAVPTAQIQTDWGSCPILNKESANTLLTNAVFSYTNCYNSHRVKWGTPCSECVVQQESIAGCHICGHWDWTADTARAIRFARRAGRYAPRAVPRSEIVPTFNFDLWNVYGTRIARQADEPTGSGRQEVPFPHTATPSTQHYRPAQLPVTMLRSVNSQQSTTIQLLPIQST